MRGVLDLVVKLQTFGSPEGLQIPNFGSVELHPHTWPKWGCDIEGPSVLNCENMELGGAPDFQH
jgi:hypothetical protein